MNREKVFENMMFNKCMRQRSLYKGIIWERQNIFAVNCPLKRAQQKNIMRKG